MAECKAPLTKWHKTEGHGLIHSKGRAVFVKLEILSSAPKAATDLNKRLIKYETGDIRPCKSTTNRQGVFYELTKGCLLKPDQKA